MGEKADRALLIEFYKNERKLKETSRIVLNGRRLTNIHPNTFASLANLTKLYLSKNKINRIFIF
jgi:Leucine-rich repeat (LRR) protein